MTKLLCRLRDDFKGGLGLLVCSGRLAELAAGILINAAVGASKCIASSCCKTLIVDTVAADFGKVCTMSMTIEKAEELGSKAKEMFETIDFEGKTYTVEFDTSMGKISLDLYPDVAPEHCKNIVALSKVGFYDDLSFHRVIDGFVIQGGCPLGTGTGGPGHNIAAEFNPKKHELGVLSMARATDPDSAGSQFFLCLGTVPHLDNQYTVFGSASDDESRSVIAKIGKVATGAGDRPLEDVKIVKATVLES